MSLKDIMKQKLDASEQTSERIEEKVESYIMLSGNKEEDRKEIIIKRMHLLFNDKECQVLNFTDITLQTRLK